MTSRSVPRRPKLLLASSPAGLPVAEFLRSEIENAAEVTAWCEGEPAPASSAFDAAAFVLCSARESAVIFRLGVFLGALGRERVFVYPASNAVELLPDLHGVTIAHDPGTLRDRLVRLAAESVPHVPDSPGHVARRVRRTLGTASSVQAGQTLRIADISLTGALLETFGEIPENQILDLELTLDDDHRVRVAAKVVRIQYPQWGRVGGVGVQFVRFEGGSQAELARYLETSAES
jgi:hypothetical protein